ncbi:non-ribosomal peptide synthetase [Kitasatospora sp. NPDC059648]|uniref:non-ribosomal peptide synthetase n=1 Tax=Kitasatospora sp. NPDC059648 TaxID=3346894 RepID=UPI00367627D3
MQAEQNRAQHNSAEPDSAEPDSAGHDSAERDSAAAPAVTAERLAELSAGSAVPAAEPVYRRFARWAEQDGGRPALLTGIGDLDYAELDSWAGELAGRLHAVGARPEQRVAICLPRSPALVAAVLAVLRAGAAFVPLDPEWPKERIRAVLADAEPCGVIGDAGTAALLDGQPVPVLDVDHGGGRPLEPVAVRPDHLAYVLYTSGSTGRPKGVLIEQQALANYVDHAARAYLTGDPAAEGAALHTPLTFDLTLTGLLAPLVTGAGVRIVPDGQGVDELAELLRQGVRFDLVKLTPAHLRMLEHALPLSFHTPAVGTFVVGGEALPTELVRPWLERMPQLRVVNEYGPTEATVGSSAAFVSDPLPAGPAVPIGRPIANVRQYVLDPELGIAGVGVAGEIHIGGAGVARGYAGLPGPTAGHFVPDPYGPPGSRLYRTGDAGRYLADGSVEFIGRLDDEAKVNGHRVSPGEIEAVLQRHEQVAAAAAVVRDVGETRRIIAFVTGRPGVRPQPEAIRAWTREVLPGYLVPSAVVPVEALPLTANGKVDRSRLPDAPVEGAGPSAPPVTPLQRALAGIWQEVLGLDEVGIDDHFLDVGGDSVATLLVAGRAAKLGIRLESRMLLDHPTIRSLGAALEDGPESARPASAVSAR